MLPYRTLAIAVPSPWPGYQALQHALNGGEPGHGDRGAGVEDHDRVRVGRGHRGDQVVLGRAEVDAGQVRALGLPRLAKTIATLAAAAADAAELSEEPAL